MTDNRLRESEETWRHLVEDSLQGFAIMQDGRMILANRALCRMSGFSLEEMYHLPPAMVLATIHPEDRARVIEAQRHIMETGRSPPAETIRLLDREGRVRWVEVLASRITYQGKPSLQVLYLDVTERLKAEEPYHSLVDHALEGFAILQEKGLAFVNQAFAHIIGYPIARLLEFTTKQLAVIVYHADRKRVFLHITAHLRGKPADSTLQFRVSHPDQGVRRLETLAVPIKYIGQPAVELSCRDVTEQWEAQDALRRTEAERKGFIDQALFGIALIDGQGQCIEWNQALEAITGIPTHEAIGRRLEELQPVFGAEGAKLFLEPIASGQTRQTETELRRAGEKPRWLLLKYYPITVPSGIMRGLMVEDVTLLKYSTQRLSEAQQETRSLAGHLLHAREEERKNIAQEIHDDLGQILTAMKMDLHWLAKRMGGQPAAVIKKTDDLIDLADQTIGMVQRISAQLRPRMLDDLGLAEALDWLGKDFSQRTKIACAVSSAFPAKKIGDEAATTIYRIVQEALTNVARHSGARHTAVSVLSRKGRLEVRIEDDGVGISAQQASAPESFGLIGMRERAESLGGSLTVSGRSGKGTLLLVSIALPQEGALP